MIVAGGGSGASGDGYYVNPGGFGGGLSGINCYYDGSLRNQGAGTQTDSTGGFGSGNNRDKGSFGLGVDRKYKSEDN